MVGKPQHAPRYGTFRANDGLHPRWMDDGGGVRNDAAPVVADDCCILNTEAIQHANNVARARFLSPYASSCSGWDDVPIPSDRRK